MKDKRSDVRISFCKEVGINTLLINERFTMLPKPIIVNVMNLSCSGMLIATYLDVPLETCFSLKLACENEEIPTLILIVRKEFLEENVWHYGCEFLQIEESAKCKIRSFIFKQQARWRAKSKSS